MMFSTLALQASVCLKFVTQRYYLVPQIIWNLNQGKNPKVDAALQIVFHTAQQFGAAYQGQHTEKAALGLGVSALHRPPHSAF